MRHPLMITMNRASALSQGGIRTAGGCTMTFESGWKRPAVMSVTVASRGSPIADWRNSRRFECRFRLHGLQKRHKRLGIRLRIARLRDDIFDRRLLQHRQRYCEPEAGSCIG